MMCYYLNVHFQDQRVNITVLTFNEWISLTGMTSLANKPAPPSPILSSVQLHLTLSEVDCFCTLRNGISFNYLMYCMLPNRDFTVMKQSFMFFLLLEIILYLLVDKFLVSHRRSTLK